MRWGEEVTLVERTDGGGIDRRGIVTPPGTRIVAEAPEGHLVLKVPGHHYFRGQGQPFGYAPTEYEVYQVSIVETHGPAGHQHREWLCRFLLAFGARA